jgi:hypothetical protein
VKGSFGKCFENDKSSPYFWATLFRDKGFALFLTKKLFGCILGVFSKTHLVTLLVDIQTKKAELPT